MWSRHRNVTDGQTTCCSNTACTAATATYLPHKTTLKVFLQIRRINTVLLHTNLPLWMTFWASHTNLTIFVQKTCEHLHFIITVFESKSHSPKHGMPNFTSIGRSNGFPRQCCGVEAYRMLSKRIKSILSSCWWQNIKTEIKFKSVNSPWTHCGGKTPYSSRTTGRWSCIRAHDRRTRDTICPWPVAGSRSS